MNRIILCNSGRFNNKQLYNLSYGDNVEYVIYDQDYVESNCFIKEVLNNCTGGFFLFNLNNPHFIYILYKIKKEKQAVTAFVQEGLASYNYRHYSFKRRLGLIKKNVSVLFKAGVKDISFYDYSFGFRGRWGKVFDYYDTIINSTLVDNFFLSLPKEARYGLGKIVQIPQFEKRSIIAANSFFSYNNTLQLRENDLVYIDQGIDGSFELVSELANKFPESNIYIKLHPSTDAQWAEHYKKTKNVVIITHLQGVPIELFLQNLFHAIVVTPFSSALLMDNPYCRYYYLYKWYINRGYDIGNSNLCAPGEHIFKIDSVAKIELY